MIDLTSERPMSLAEVAALLPPARNGRPVHLSCVMRWILTGARGPDGRRVRLDAIRLGGRWVTSREALHRFAAALTPRCDDEDPTPAMPRTDGARRRGAERAAKELDELGI